MAIFKILLKLGIIIKNDRAINHHSLLKIFLNPLLRKFGYQLGSVFQNNQFISYRWMRIPKTKKVIWFFRYDREFDSIKKERIWF